MQFPIMYVGTGSILELCTEHQMTCKWGATAVGTLVIVLCVQLVTTQQEYLLFNI